MVYGLGGAGGSNDDPVSVAVLVPAHNEQDCIAETLISLKAQTRRPDRLIVIADNCSDRTAEIARTHGAEVFELVGNMSKKAGALNYGINHLLEADALPDFLVNIDADTVLDEHFLERALSVMTKDSSLGGLSAVCRGKRGLGNSIYQKTLAWLQSAEYARAGWTRLRHNIHTLSGAGSMIRRAAILDVVNDRGEFYAERQDNLVEDYEITLELKRHGWHCTNNFHCIAYTDLMLSLSALFRQRVRWMQGGINELRHRGLRAPEVRRSIATLTYVYGAIPLFYIWIGFFIWHGRLDRLTLEMVLLLGLYQTVTIWRLGKRSAFLAVLLIPELLFNVMSHAWLLSSAWKAMKSSNETWS